MSMDYPNEEETNIGYQAGCFMFPFKMIININRLMGTKMWKK